MTDEQAGEDFQKSFRRARRALRHFWHISREQHDYYPHGCDGCKEVRRILTDSTYRGDEYYPVGVDENPLGPEAEPDAALGPDWTLDAADMGEECSSAYLDLEKQALKLSESDRAHIAAALLRSLPRENGKDK
jgi:hypothetical protein